ncbi:MAG TPA: MarR family transcriptional regulator [Acidimicrobiales bacterium]|nr:MarR family transcriptional regulator [Acidimicrobiales bacterium]
MARSDTALGRVGGREGAIDRYLQLRPSIRARMESSVPEGLRAEFASVTAHQLRALALLEDGGLSMRQLASALGVMGATTSVLADRLVAQGLAVREHDPGDRRVVRLLLTEEGRRVADRYQEAQRRAARSLFDRLSDEQIVAWMGVLETLAADQTEAAASSQA